MPDIKICAECGSTFERQMHESESFWKYRQLCNRCFSAEEWIQYGMGTNIDKSQAAKGGFVSSVDYGPLLSNYFSKKEISSMQTKKCCLCGRDTHTVNRILCEECEKVNPDYVPKKSTIQKRGQCLEKAQKTINGERQTSHGTPEDSFGTIARYWEVYLRSIGFDVSLKKSDITTMMSLFKHARMSGQRYTEDNYTDAAGYIGLAADFRAEEDK